MRFWTMANPFQSNFFDCPQNLCKSSYRSARAVGCETRSQKNIQNDYNIIPEWSQNDFNTITKWFQSGSQSDSTMITKWFKDDLRMITKCSQMITNDHNDHKMVPGSLLPLMSHCFTGCHLNSLDFLWFHLMAELFADVGLSHRSHAGSATLHSHLL